MCVCVGSNTNICVCTYSYDQNRGLFPTETGWWKISLQFAIVSALSTGSIQLLQLPPGPLMLLWKLLLRLVPQMMVVVVDAV